MKQLVSISSNAYLFWRITRTASSKHCIGQYGRYFSAIKAVKGTHKEIFSTAGLDSKRQKNFGKKFSSNAQKALTLMDFDVWMRPKISSIIRGAYSYFFELGDLEGFSIAEFTKCSSKALQVVTTLLSQLKFSELEGLLTPECKQQVESSLKYWTKSQLSCLAFKPEQEKSTIPCEILVFSDDNNKQKSFVEVRVIHYVWLPFCDEFQSPFESRIIRNIEQNFGKLHMGTVFNCKFIREITKGSADQWTMNAINLKVCPELLTKL